MNRAAMLVIAAVLSIVVATPCAAQPAGTQLDRSAATVLVQKDVGAERWAISMNLEFGLLSGNVFFTDARPPIFISCEPTGEDYDPATATLLLRNRCFAADSAPGSFSPGAWTLINENVVLNANFFFPSSDSCNLTAAANGATGATATTFWQCTGQEGDFNSQFFLDGNGTSTTTPGGTFTYNVSQDGCGFKTIEPNDFVARFAYSPTLDVLNWYEPKFDGGFFVSTCRRMPVE